MRKLVTLLAGAALVAAIGFAVAATPQATSLTRQTRERHLSASPSAVASPSKHPRKKRQPFQVKAAALKLQANVMF